MKKFNSINLLFLFFVLLIVNTTDSFSQDGEGVFEKVKPSVVVIIASDCINNDTSQGSGVVIDNQGFIATNFHVCSDCKKITVKHQGNVINDVPILGSNVSKDILILKIQPNLIPAIETGEISDIKEGQTAFTIGAPLGLELTISPGIISGFRYVSGIDITYIQHTCPISRGSSGGPLVNEYGELVGINTFYLMDEPGHIAQNLNFAIPVDEVLKVYNDANDNFKRIKNNPLKALLEDVKMIADQLYVGNISFDFARDFVVNEFYVIKSLEYYFKNEEKISKPLDVLKLVLLIIVSAERGNDLEKMKKKFYKLIDDYSKDIK